MPNIYLLQDSGDAVELSEQPYNSEDILQRLLAEHPDILGGDQIGGGRPRRWLFVAREAGIPSEEAGADRWSLDHLFVDQDGTPTLVEVKRSSIPASGARWSGRCSITRRTPPHAGRPH